MHLRPRPSWASSGECGNVAERRRCDSLQRNLWLLTQRTRRYCACVHDSLRELACVSSDIPKGRAASLTEGSNSSRHTTSDSRAPVDDSLRQLRRVLGDSTQHKRRCLLVKSVLLRQRVHELREDPLPTTASATASWPATARC